MKTKSTIEPREWDWKAWFCQRFVIDLPEQRKSIFTPQATPAEVINAIEQIEDKAYQKGLEEGKSFIGKTKREGYQRGYEDALERVEKEMNPFPNICDKCKKEFGVYQLTQILNPKKKPKYIWLCKTCLKENT